MDGRQLLAGYIGREKGRQAQFARESGCSESYLSLFLKGKRQLSLKMAKRVSEATNGQVPVDALVLSEKLEAAE